MDYSNLKICGRQVRLITINPLQPHESDSEPIHCTIETAILPSEPNNLDLSRLSSSYISFDNEVTDAPDESFGGSIRRDVAKIEGTCGDYDGEHHKPEYDIIVPISDIVNMISAEDLLTVIQNAELNDKIRLNRPDDRILCMEGHLNTMKLDPFFRPSPPETCMQPIDPKNYVAMSYSWGPDHLTAPIFLNGTKVDVRVNLEQGLRRFRSMDYFKRGGKIWIDALCINQADEAEKASQIPLMGSIYKLAGNVIVWLGPEADESSETIETLQNLGSLYRTEYIEAFDNSDPFTATAWRQMAQVRLRTSFHRLKKMYTQLDFDSSAEDVRLYRFFDRPYWRRLWIIQELCMGRAGMPVVCGPRVTQWRHIRDGVFAHTAFQDVMQEHLPAAVMRHTREPMVKELSLLHVAQIAQLEIYGHRKRLPEVDTTWLPVSTTFGYGHGPLHGSAFRRALVLASQAECFHPHDCVYGLLNIPGLPDLGIKVDYSQDITSVFTEFASACITKGKSLELFSLVDGLPMSGRGIGAAGVGLKYLPSWVPCLTRTAEQRVGVIEGDWHASGNKQDFIFDGVNLEPRIRDPNILVCYGFVAEIVDGVGAISKPDVGAGRSDDRFQRGVVQPTSRCSLEQIHYTSETEEENDPRTRAARAAAGDPRVSWVLTCGADIQGTKHSFECLYGAFPEKEPSYDSPYWRNWHFINSSGDLVVRDRPLASYFKPFSEEDDDHERRKETRAARQAMEARTRNRRLIVTDSGLLGLAPIFAQPGDAVMVLVGHGRPVIARNLKDEDGQETPLWHLIGEAFVNGMMEWEMMDRDIMSGPKKLRQLAFI